MAVRRMAGATVLLALASMAVAPRADAGALRVEAEGLPVDNAACDVTRDQEQMRPAGGQWASGGATMFYPNGGGECSQTLAGTPRLAGVFYIEHGGVENAWYCGHFELSGGAIGTTPVRCARAGTRILAPFDGTVPTGPVTVTWYTDEDTPDYVNAAVDYFVTG